MGQAQWAIHEDEWVLTEVFKQCVHGLIEKGYSPDNIAGIGVDGTSGTILPLASDNQLLTNAFMYNDSRSEKETLQVQELQRARTRLAGGTDPGEVLDELARSLTNKLLHQPTVAIRDATASDRSDVLDLIRTLYQIDPD